MLRLGSIKIYIFTAILYRGLDAPLIFTTMLSEATRLAHGHCGDWNANDTLDGIFATVGPLSPIKCNIAKSNNEELI